MELKIDLQSRGTRIIYDSLDRYIKLIDLISIADGEDFDGMQLPSVEPYSIYVDKAGSEVLNQMYTFQDKSNRDLCLRPEVTATIQLIADKHWKNEEKRVWYFEKCWRYERPQKGRYREFWQFGVEILNPKKDYTDYLIELGSKMVSEFTDNYSVYDSVKRGLDYYTEDGFEIVCDELGSQKQVLGGGAYRNGIGFALGFDRLMLLNK